MLQRYRFPDNIDSICIEHQQFDADADRHVEAPIRFSAVLLSHGFVHSPKAEIPQEPQEDNDFIDSLPDDGFEQQPEAAEEVQVEAAEEIPAAEVVEEEVVEEAASDPQPKRRYAYKQ